MLTLYHDLAAQNRREVEVEDGVGDDRPTYVFAGAAKKLKVQNSDDTDSSLDCVPNTVPEMDEIR